MFISIEALNKSAISETLLTTIIKVAKEVKRVKIMNTPIDKSTALVHLLFRFFLIFLFIRGAEATFFTIILRSHFFV